MSDEAALEKTKRSADMARTTNAALMNEIESLGGSIDLATARIEHFMVELVALGIITETQQWDEQLSWEKFLKLQLIPVRDRLREAHEMAGIEARKSNGKRKPPGSGLILPPGPKRN